MTRIMAIETSGRIGSVAVGVGSQLVAEQDFGDQLKHGAQLLPTMERLCQLQGWQPGDIDHLYVSAGPGSFTGIRIAVTAAKVLAFAQNTKIVPVPSLEALALNAEKAGQDEKLDIKQVATVQEAGRGQIFTAVFDRETTDAKDDSAGLVPGFRINLAQTMMTPAELLERTKRPLYLTGEGLKYHHEELSPNEKDSQIVRLDEKYWQPQAANVYRCGLLRAQQGLFVTADQLEPIYLRRPEAVEKWEELYATRIENSASETVKFGRRATDPRINGKIQS